MGGSKVRIESVSSRVGVEEAETKLSFDDLESAVDGLASRSSSGVVILDSCCPSLLAMNDRFRVSGIFDAEGNRPERSLPFLGAFGRGLLEFIDVSVDSSDDFCSVFGSTVLLEVDRAAVPRPGFNAGGLGLAFFVGTSLNSS